MKVSQSIPTDSLYKFSAISGLILFSISLVFGFYLKFMSDNMEKASDLYYPSIKAEELIKQIDCRLDAINNKLDKCKIKQTVSDGSEIEINQLQHIKRVQKDTIAIYKKYDDISRPLYENLGWAIDVGGTS
ncbi:hypothetical protein [Pseudoalteromonas distincta]|uniref:hypothetical protein n=1 Tax=Pseudoalteromonas distincta TaxID=77608 RepID=UPI0039E9197E